MIDFVLLGSGWRSLFYARLSVRFPHEFRLTGWMVHDPAKRIAYAQEYHTFTSHALDEVLERPHDLVVLCVPDTLQHDLLVTLAERGEPVLTETSFLRQNEASLKDLLVRCKGKRWRSPNSTRCSPTTSRFPTCSPGWGRSGNAPWHPVISTMPQP
jgi:hypothetical protein